MEEEEFNPFSEENYRYIEFTQLSRIYDTLLTLVQIQDPDAAMRLQQAHAAGKLVGPSPGYTGEFLFDVVNAPEDVVNAGDDIVNAREDVVNASEDSANNPTDT